MKIFVLASTILGNALQFSSGGPGKGMYSRAYREILYYNHFVNSVSVINNVFSDSGIFGITLEGASHKSFETL